MLGRVRFVVCCRSRNPYGMPLPASRKNEAPPFACYAFQQPSTPLEPPSLDHPFLRLLAHPPLFRREECECKKSPPFSLCVEFPIWSEATLKGGSHPTLTPGRTCPLPSGKPAHISTAATAAIPPFSLPPPSPTSPHPSTLTSDPCLGARAEGRVSGGGLHPQPRPQGGPAWIGDPQYPLGERQ